MGSAQSVSAVKPAGKDTGSGSGTLFVTRKKSEVGTAIQVAPASATPSQDMKITNYETTLQQAKSLTSMISLNALVGPATNPYAHAAGMVIDMAVEEDASKKPRKKTGVICTIGPSSDTEEKLLQLLESGMTVMRMNFSHGTHEYHGANAQKLRNVLKRNPHLRCSIALDTKGPEIRLGRFQDDKEITLEKGQKFTLTTDKAWMTSGNQERSFVDYENITKVIQAGFTIFMNDGHCILVVEKIVGNDVICVVQNNCKISSKKGCNLPGAKVDLPAVSEKDKDDLAFAAQARVDYIFASFVRRGEHVREIRRLLSMHGAGDIAIFAKIENQEGMENLDSIISEADGIMVARGDLGVEIPIEKVNAAQKLIVAKCTLAGKPVICATQMLESMTHEPRPTRAEVADVSNAIEDGADMIMLSGETAGGKYPLQAAKTMNDIAVEAESHLDVRTIRRLIFEASKQAKLDRDGIRVAQHAHDKKCSLILVPFTNEVAVRHISKFKPSCHIFARADSERNAARLRASRGVDTYISVNASPEDGLRIARETGFAYFGQDVMLVNQTEDGFVGKIVKA